VAGLAEVAAPSPPLAAGLEEAAALPPPLAAGLAEVVAASPPSRRVVGPAEVVASEGVYMFSP